MLGGGGARFRLYVSLRLLLRRRGGRAGLSGVSWAVVGGIAVSCFAVVVVLSVFNGITSLVNSLYTSLDTDVAIRSLHGAGFAYGDSLRSVVQETLPAGSRVGLSLSETALFDYGDRQQVGTLLGVDTAFCSLSDLGGHAVYGEFKLYRGRQPLANLTTGMAYYLGASPEHYQPVRIYLPNRTAAHWLDASNAFGQRNMALGAIISVNGDFDEHHVIVPIEVVQDLLLRDAAWVGTLHVDLPDGVDADDVIADLGVRLAGEYEVLSRWAQNASLYMTVQSERLAILLILGLILVVACFSLVGCLSMLTASKHDQMVVLSSLGMGPGALRRVFILQGLELSVLGSVLGVAVGLLVCWLQWEFGIVRFEGSGSFIVDAYPVEVHASDVVWVLVSGFLAGGVASVVALWRQRFEYEASQVG